MKASAEPSAEAPNKKYEPTLLAGHRKVITDRLSLSARTAVHVPITMEVNMTPASKLKAEKERATLPLSYTDFIVKAAALALEEFPAVNTMLFGQELRKMNEVNVGVASDQGTTYWFR
jgi:pyruvate dehydrogenase E2 component (dihydrolipoamide acetyltransferase)